MNQNYCTNCGEPLAEGVSFCTNCGAAVEATAPSPPLSSAQTIADAPSTVEQPAKPTARATVPTASKRSGGISSNAIIGGIAVVAALLVVVYFAFLRPDNTNADIPYPDVVRTSVEDAYASFEEGSALFLDVRDRDSYTTMHIPGAVWLPLTDVEARMDELPPDVEIITYCT